MQGNNLEQNLKGRPIVNGFQLTYSTISRIINEYMINIHENFKILFEQKGISLPCIANSDRRLISELEKLHTFDFINLTNIWFITFDFESLYTKVTRKYVIECM